MYSLMVKTSFVVYHFLIGKDFGPENHNHSHQYLLEVEFEGEKLDSFNYLIDILDVQKNLDQIVNEYKNKTLNELSEFQNTNPSLELFSKIIWKKLTSHIKLPSDFKVIVRLWEDDIARASYRE